MVTLVTDRAASDLSRLQAILSKSVSDWTDEDREYFFQDVVRGAYNYTDLNRVTAAMEDIHARLVAYGYKTEYVPLFIESGRTEWREEDIPTREQMEHHLANLRAVRAGLDLLDTTPDSPADMDGLTFSEANDIEQILTDLDFQVVTMATTFIPCGEAICGGDNL